jgi:hypothetical protein
VLRHRWPGSSVAFDACRLRLPMSFVVVCGEARYADQPLKFASS